MTTLNLNPWANLANKMGDKNAIIESENEESIEKQDSFEDEK